MPLVKAPQLTRAILAIAVAITVPNVARADEKPRDIDETCALTACRQGGFEVMLSTDEKAHTYIGIPVSRSPYVLEDGAILIFPGETLVFKFNIDNGTLGKPEFIMAFAPQMPARVDINGKLSDNPLNANLPPLPTKDGDVDMSALPANSIILSYGEASQHKIGMMLSTDSTLTRAIKFEDTMYVVHPGKSGYTEFHTSTCPVRAGIGAFETWPHPIGPMILTNLRFVPDKETVCN